MQSQLRQRKRYCVKLNDSHSFRNLGQVKVLLYVPCVKTTSVLHMEEKRISIDTSKYRYVGAA